MMSSTTVESRSESECEHLGLISPKKSRITALKFRFGAKQTLSFAPLILSVFFRFQCFSLWLPSRAQLTTTTLHPVPAKETEQREESRRGETVKERERERDAPQVNPLTSWQNGRALCALGLFKHDHYSSEKTRRTVRKTFQAERKRHFTRLQKHSQKKKERRESKHQLRRSPWRV